MFFMYSQNNPGGVSELDGEAGIGDYVIVEADSPWDANGKAEDIGLYFDGKGDCKCCVNRWYARWEDDLGDKVPSVYGTPVEEFWRDEVIFVHFADGTRKSYGWSK